MKGAYDGLNVLRCYLILKELKHVYFCILNFHLCVYHEIAYCIYGFDDSAQKILQVWPTYRRPQAFSTQDKTYLTSVDLQSRSELEITENCLSLTLDLIVLDPLEVLSALGNMLFRSMSVSRDIVQD